MSDFAFLRGALVLAVEGMKEGSERVRIVTDRGTLSFFHYQDCCESVSVEDVTGDVEDFTGSRIAEFREDTNHESGGHGEVLWTFYNIITDIGDFQIRWYGTSNGYYSVSVSHNWEPGKAVPVSLCLHPPFAAIRRIEEDGSAWDANGDFVMKLTKEAAQNLLENYTLN